MEVDDIQTQVSNKFQRISCCNDKDSSSNYPSGNKIGGNIMNKVSTYEAGGRLYGWPSSRIVRVSRASGGKDRHSKVLTSKGLRDRRVRLSVTTAIQFYDLQDRLGYDQPSKAVEWLIKAAATSIAELPSLDPSFMHLNTNNNNNNSSLRDEEKKVGDDNNNNEVLLSRSSSSASENSKGSSGLSLSRSENRIRARERARGLAAAKTKEKENIVNGDSQTTSSFTDLLTGGIRNNNSSTPMDYFQMEQQFGNNCSQSQHQQQHQQQHFSFLQENLSYATSSLTTSSGYNRGTLQSNLMSNLPHHHLQRFQPMVDGSTSTNFPFFLAPNMGGSGGTNQFLATGLDSQRLRLYGGDGGGNYYDHHKDKSKS